MTRERHTQLFFAILGLSAVSWGGLALMAQLERRYVDKKRLITREAFADLVAVAWTVPGPVACNVAVQLGYVLRGHLGAWIAGVASVLPFFVIMTGLASAYAHHSMSLVAASHIMSRFSIVLARLISVTFARQARSLLRSRSEQLIALSSTLLLLEFNHPATFVGVLTGSFLIGWMAGPRQKSPPLIPLLNAHDKFSLVFFPAVLTVFAFVPLNSSRVLDIVRQAGAGLTLFGGGFSAIPILKGLFLAGNQTLPAAAFTAAFSLSSIVPGPLLNVVPFLGFLQQGLFGATCSTVALFLPTGAMAILAQKWRRNLKKSVRFEHALTYLRAATSAFLAVTVIRIVPQIDFSWMNISIAAVTVVALSRWAIPVYWLYLGTAVISFFV
jgi:chromate transporter